MKQAEDPILSEDVALLSDEAAFLRLKVNHSIWDTLNDFEKAEDYLKQALDFIEANPNFLREFPMHHLSTLNNLGVLYLKTKQYAKAESIVEKVNADLYQHFIHKVSAHQMKMNLQSAVLLEARDLSNLAHLYDDFEECWSIYGANFQAQFRKSMASNMFQFNFFLKDYRAAKRFYQIVANGFSFEVRPDLSWGTELGYICLNFDQGNWDIVESKSRSLARNSKFEDPSWKVISNHFLRLLRSNGDDLNAFNEFLRAVQDAESTDLVIALRNFDLEAWLTSKIEGISFAEAFEMKGK